jgi:hypothetical protein
VSRDECKDIGHFDQDAAALGTIADPRLSKIGSRPVTPEAAGPSPVHPAETPAEKSEGFRLLGMIGRCAAGPAKCCSAWPEAVGSSPFPPSRSPQKKSRWLSLAWAAWLSSSDKLRLRVGRTPVADHRVVRVQAADGRGLELSPGRPTADGRTFGNLRPGTRLDGAAIASVELEPHRYTRTPTTSCPCRAREPTSPRAC